MIQTGFKSINRNPIRRFLNFVDLSFIKTQMWTLLFLPQVLWHVQTGHWLPLHPLRQRLPFYAHQKWPMFPVSSCEREHGWRWGGALIGSFILKGIWWTSCWTPRWGCWSSGRLWNWCPNWWNPNSGASSSSENMVSVLPWFTTRGRCRRTGGQMGPVHEAPEEIPSSFLTSSVGRFLTAFPVYFYSKPKLLEIFSKIKIFPFPDVPPPSSARWTPTGGRLAGPVWRLPADYGAGERCDQPGAAGPRMVQSKDLIFLWSGRIDPADVIIIKAISCPPAAGGVAKLHC